MPGRNQLLCSFFPTSFSSFCCLKSNQTATVRLRQQIQHEEKVTLTLENFATVHPKGDLKEQNVQRITSRFTRLHQTSSLPPSQLASLCLLSLPHTAGKGDCSLSKEPGVNAQHPLFLLPPPPQHHHSPPHVSLQVDNGIFCEQVTKT